MMFSLRNKDEQGFTLIELMIVIAIIGILSAIAIPNFLSYRTKGADSSAKHSLSSFYSAALSDYADTGTAGTYDLGNSATWPSTFSLDTSTMSGLGGTFTVDGNGGVTGSVTASHKSSNTTFTIDTKGVITSS